MRSEDEIREYLEQIEYLYDMVSQLQDETITEIDLEKNKTMICTLKWVLQEDNQ